MWINLEGITPILPQRDHHHHPPTTAPEVISILHEPFWHRYLPKSSLHPPLTPDRCRFCSAGQPRVASLSKPSQHRGIDRRGILFALQQRSLLWYLSGWLDGLRAPSLQGSEAPSPAFAQPGLPITRQAANPALPCLALPTLARTLLQSAVGEVGTGTKSGVSKTDATGY